MSATLPRSERLRSMGALRRLFDEGESGFVYPFRHMFYLDSAAESASPEVLFSVPKRYHKRANKRNLLRRRTKEAYRLNKSMLTIESGALDMALIYSAKEVVEYKRVENAVKKILGQIAQHL